MGVTGTGTALYCALLKYLDFADLNHGYSLSKIVRFLKWGRTSPGLSYAESEQVDTKSEASIYIVALYRHND